MTAFNDLFDDTAADHFALLGGETITLSRPHALVDSQGRAVVQVRVAANASIGATAVTIEPLSGTVKGRLPVGMILASGVVTSAELELANLVSAASVAVVALTAGLTAGTIWALPAGSTWSIADCLPFEDKPNLLILGQSGGGDADRQQQTPHIAIPTSAGVEPRIKDVIAWSQGRVSISAVKRMSDSYDVSFKAAA